MSAGRALRGEVGWHLPSSGGFRRRPFAYTTRASADLIAALAVDESRATHRTWAEVHDALLFDREARLVAKAFVDAGFGDIPAITHLSGARPD